MCSRFEDGVLYELPGCGHAGRRPPKFDLTPYLGLVPEVGQVAVYETSWGEVIRREVLDVVPWRKGFRVSGQSVVDGEAVMRGDRVIIQGRKTLALGMDLGGIPIDLKRPMTVRRHWARLSRRNRIRGSGSAEIDGIRVKARVKGSWTFWGFDAVETPGGSYEDAALVSQSLTVKLKRGDTAARLVVGTAYWYGRGIGMVAATEQATIRMGGALLEDLGRTETWRIEDH